MSAKLKSNQFRGWPSGDYIPVLSLNIHPRDLIRSHKNWDLEFVEDSDDLGPYVGTHFELANIGPVVFQYHTDAPQDIEQTLVLIDRDADIVMAAEQIADVLDLTHDQIIWQTEAAQLSLGAH